MSVVALSGFTWTARFEPAPPATENAYSPSPRHEVVLPLQSVGLDEPCVSKLKRGSNAFDALGWIEGNVYVLGLPPAPPVSGVNVMTGATAVPPRFCTMIGVRRPAAFFAAYAPYTVAAPPVTPSVDPAIGAAVPGASFCVLTTTATGCDALTVTAYCLPLVRPGAPRFGSSELGSIGFARPASTVRVMTIGPLLPSNGRNVAVAVVAAVPRFWMMNGVTNPK